MPANIFGNYCQIYMIQNRSKKIRGYLIFALSGRNQVNFAKCYSELLFCYWVQRETYLYYKFKTIATCRLPRRPEWHLESYQVVIVMPIFDDMT